MTTTITVPDTIVEAFLRHVRAGLEGIDHQDMAFETRDDVWQRSVALIATWDVDRHRYGCYVPLPAAVLDDEPMALDMLAEAAPKAVSAAREAIAADHP